MRQNWNKLKREDAHKVLDRLSGERDAVVFTRDVTEVTWRALPFYKNYKLYKLVNYATMPTFSMTYLTNGEEFIPLDGTANPIYAVNEKDDIHLDETTVIPYLDFFFSNVQGSEGDVFLIRDPRKMPFMDSLSENQQQSVISTFKPINVSFDPEKNLVKLSGTIYYGGGLIAATISVSPNGRLAFEEQQLLLSGIYFPYTPYAQGWLEGENA